MADKPPFDAEKWAMFLLGVLIVTPSILVLVITLRCAISLDEVCWNKPWPGIFRDWLGETIPVLVAIIMSRRNNRP